MRPFIMQARNVHFEMVAGGINYYFNSKYKVKCRKMNQWRGIAS